MKTKYTLEQKQKKLEILEAELKLSILQGDKKLIKKNRGRVRIQKYYIRHHSE